MKPEEINEKFAGVTDEQRRAERMMLAAIVRSGDLDLLKSAMDAAMSTTGLLIPTGMDPLNGVILTALWDALDDGEEPTPDRIEDRVIEVYDGDDGGGYYGAAVAGIWRSDPGATTAIEWGLEVARCDLERWALGQRVWPVALYRWFDIDKRLLYVGISKNLAGRQDSHSKRSSWGHFAETCKVARYPNREDAEAMERHAIKRERPLFNHVHNDTPEARERLVAYLVEHGRLDLLAPAVTRG